MSPDEMQARIAALEADNEHLTQVIAAHRTLADAHRELLARADTERSKAMVVVRQVSDALDRLAELEAQAKQAREDEEWFSRQHEATVYKVVLGWLVECDGGRVESGAIADGIRALRANVEGGAR